MAFGQHPGPPATPRQLRELQRLLEEAGHTDFRDARGPMRFTQRQAGGRFTRDEAQAFIDQLEQAAHDGAPPAAAAAGRTGPAAGTADDRALRGVSDERLAAELQRRGWIVVEP